MKAIGLQNLTKLYAKWQAEHPEAGEKQSSQDEVDDLAITD